MSKVVLNTTGWSSLGMVILATPLDTDTSKNSNVAVPTNSSHQGNDGFAITSHTSSFTVWPFTLPIPVTELNNMADYPDFICTCTCRNIHAH